MPLMLGYRKAPLAVLATAFLLASCRTVPVPAPATEGAPPSTGSGKVILISLDGASSTELHRRYRQGELRAGGFARFFEQGVVADSLTPVVPTLTAVNHITLATGFPPGATGIVSNNFHPAGTPWGERASGFAAPIGTETLWEAARRQGKRTGVWTFPGADDTGPRRRADWGLTYVGKLHPSTTIDLQASSFQPVEGERLPPGLPSHFGPARAVTVQGAGEGDGRSFQLIAIDTRDDGKETFDALWATPTVPDGAAPERIAPGGWCRVDRTDAQQGPTASWLLLQELAPDLSRVRLYLGAEFADKAYPPSFAAELAANGVRWPGPPDDEAYEATWERKPGIDLSAWIEQSIRFSDFFYDGLAWAAGRSDWDLLLGYVPTIDEAGHELTLEVPRQPGYTPERGAAFAAARRQVWQAADRGIARLLAKVDLRTTTVILVSDHGMAPISTRFDPNVFLKGQGLAQLGADGRVDPSHSKALAICNGGVSHVYLAPDLQAEERTRLLALLRRELSRVQVDGHRVVDRIFEHAELSSIGLDHPNSGDLVLFARPGVTFAEWPLPGGAVGGPTDVYGMHGHFYRGNGVGDRRLAGIFLEIGRGVSKRPLGELKNTEVAPIASSFLGIEPPRRLAD